MANTNNSIILKQNENSFLFRSDNKIFYFFECY